MMMEKSNGASRRHLFVLCSQKVWPLPWETDVKENHDYFVNLKQDGLDKSWLKVAISNALTEMQSDRDVVMSAVSNNAFWGLESACDELKDNFDVVLAAVSKMAGLSTCIKEKMAITPLSRRLFHRTEELYGGLQKN